MVGELYINTNVAWKVGLGMEVVGDLGKFSALLYGIAKVVEYVPVVGANITTDASALGGLTLAGIVYFSSSFMSRTGNAIKTKAIVDEAAHTILDKLPKNLDHIS